MFQNPYSEHMKTDLLPTPKELNLDQVMQRFSTDGAALSVSSVVNILLQRPDINLAAAITALQSKRMLEMLADEFG